MAGKSFVSLFLRFWRQLKLKVYETQTNFFRKTVLQNYSIVRRQMTLQIFESVRKNV